MEETLAIQCADFFRWLFSHRNKRCGLKSILLLCILFIIIVGCALGYFHFLLTRLEGIPDKNEIYRSRWKLEQLVDDQEDKVMDLRLHVEDLKRIKSSVRNELRDLENKQHKLREEIANYSAKLDMLKLAYEKDNKQLQELKLSIDSAERHRNDISLAHAPLLQAPIYVSASKIEFVPQSNEFLSCNMRTCFDYSRCPIGSKFYAYLYSKEDLWLANLSVDVAVYESLKSVSQQNIYITTNPNIACLFLVAISVSSTSSTLFSRSNYTTGLQKLRYWEPYGTNHLLIVSVTSPRSLGNIFLSHNQTGKALLAQLEFSRELYRNNFDIVLNPVLETKITNIWSQLPPVVPAFRKYLLSFVGSRPPILPLSSKIDKRDKTINGKREALLLLEQHIIETLKNMQANFAEDGFLFDFSCAQSELIGANDEWSLCDSSSKRQNLLLQSTFSLIIAPIFDSHVSTVLVQIRLYEALKYGAIPIILGDNLELPYAELLPWKQVALMLPRVRITELHYFIRSFASADILNMRRHGRIVWSTHFSTQKGMLDTLLATVRNRLGIPPSPLQDITTDTWFVGNFSLLTKPYAPLSSDADEFLGPLEFPFSSPQFIRNHTQLWNTFHFNADPFHLFPNTPFDPIILPDAHFIGSDAGFRPIGNGLGGAGKEFSESLGGNYPHEQFTVVLLTYEREAVMIDALLRLRGLPYLNKVIIVWNSPRPPSSDLLWPDIGVPIHVAKMTKNSLNNRFLPFDAIQTEAILSLDDDVHLRRDEIIFGFRVWREARDQIVGFPGRFHVWDSARLSWMYNSNYSCELSMVLTGAAFFHKYYTYLYSFIMPQAIRDKVDEYLNCEDIAMNFLIAHIIRKPPIKVTSRWTFLCPECPSALSIEDEHFHERHKCFEFFVKVYGYMPLLYTQLRADSVLFKTRIPHDKQKCFKYV